MSVTGANVNLALCTEFRARKCKNRCCFAFFNKKEKTKRRDSDLSSEDDEEFKEIEREISNVTILNAPKVHVHLNAEQANETDFYLFDTNLKYFVVQGPHLHKKYMRLSKVIGNNVKDCGLPENISVFLENLYTETLEGHHLQVQMFMDGKSYLVNTYPIRDEHNETIGGMLTCNLAGPILHDVKTFRIDDL